MVCKVQGSSPTDACRHVQVCGSNGSTTMLATERLAGVTPKMNLRHSLHVGDEACKHGIHPGFEIQDRCY